MPFATINGIELYHEVHGEEGPSIIFVHGFFGNHAAWYQQVTYFARSGRVITLDVRGFGLSSDRSGAGLGQAVDDLRALMDVLDVQAATLVGQSLGGNICLGFARAFPERVQALVLADSLGGMTLPEELRMMQEELAARTRELSVVERMLSPEFVRVWSDQVELFLQILSFNQIHPNPSGGSARRQEPPSLDEVRKLASQIPLLFLVGQEDLVQPLSLVSAVANSISGTELAVIPDSGHSAYFEQARHFNECVERFLGQAGLRSTVQELGA